MKTKKQNKKKTIEKLAVKLLKLMGTSAEVEVGEDKKNEALVVDIQTTDEMGLIIGNRGRTLNSIQILLGMMFKQETGEWQRVIVNVADWREREEDRLKQLGFQASERAISTGEPQSLFNLNSHQRRIVHLALADDKNVKTESLGEGRDRYLIVYPKHKSGN